jgi:hypothetical protein
VFRAARAAVTPRRASGDNARAWEAVKIAVEHGNEVEAQARRAGASLAPTPSALDAHEIEAIWKTIRAEFVAAAKLCDVLATDDTYLPQIFHESVEANARQGLLEIGDQLGRYLKTEGNIVIDAGRALDSSGTVLQNEGRGVREHAKMTVTKLWADKDHEHRLSALVHEASHGAGTATRDHAYLGTWSFEALTPEQQLTNAPHFELVAEMVLGLRTQLRKPLESNIPATHQQLLRVLLGRADTVMTQRRLRTGRVLRVLNISRTARAAVAPSGEDVAPVAGIGKALALPYAGREGRPVQIAATNLDIELFGLFRSWLETIHRTLTNIRRLDLTKAEVVSLSDDRATLTVPLRWAKAEDVDIESFVEYVARCLPTIGNWSEDALVIALRALPYR